MLLAGELKIKGLVPQKVFNEETEKVAEAQNSSKDEKVDQVGKEAAENKTPTAKKLKIKGLASGKAFIEPSIVVASLQNNEEEEGVTLDESTDGYQVMEVESETIAFQEKVRVKKDTSHFLKEFISDASELEEKIESMMEKGEKGFVCKMCENYAGTRQHVIYHIEANHVEGMKHLCTECNRFYKVRDNTKVTMNRKMYFLYHKVRHSLQSHINRKHKKGSTPNADLSSLQRSVNSLKEEIL